MAGNKGGTITKATAQKARTRARAGDATGRKDDELRAKAVQDAKDAQTAEQRAAAEEAQRRDEIIDVSGAAPLQGDIADEVLIVEDDEQPLTDEELFERLAGEEDPEQKNHLLARLANRFGTYKRAATEDLIDQGITVVDEDTRIIRVNEDLENVTIGHGNNYSFEAGQRYRVPTHVAEHLDEKGYVWH